MSETFVDPPKKPVRIGLKEWVSLIAIMTVAFGLLGWYIQVVVTQGLEKSSGKLIRADLAEIRFEAIEKRLDKLEEKKWIVQPSSRSQTS